MNEDSHRSAIEDVEAGGPEAAAPVDWAEANARWVVEMSADGSLVNNIAALLRQEVREREYEAYRKAREECEAICLEMGKLVSDVALCCTDNSQIRCELDRASVVLKNAAKSIRSTIKDATHD